MKEKIKRLSPQAFERSRRFLETKARPLERAAFAYQFMGAPVDRVLDELACFQNSDGGFGRALEPDLRTPSSSALATGLGLRTLKELGCVADHPMVRKAVAYLVDTFDPGARTWQVAPADANAFPHAPWWHDDNGNLTQRFDGFRIIPRALIVALLHHYSALVQKRWLLQSIEETVKYIERVKVLGGGGGSDLEYSISLAEAENLSPQFKARLKARIEKAIPAVVVRDASKWSSYCITPLRIIPAPQSLGADLITDELQMHLDYQIAHQTQDGTWDPTWSWGGAYPADWEQAKLEWRGVLTLEALSQLRAFRRLEQ